MLLRLSCYQKVVIICSGKLPASKFKNLIYLKAFRALAEPGEAVGLLAAQVRTKLKCTPCLCDVTLCIFCNESISDKSVTN